MNNYNTYSTEHVSSQPGKILSSKIILILILIGIGLLILGIFIGKNYLNSGVEKDITKSESQDMLNMKTNEFENWVTHTYDEFGYSIKVPEDWTIRERKDVNFVEFRSADGDDYFSITFCENGKGCVFNGSCETYIEKRDYEYDEVALAGLSGYRFYSPGGQNPPSDLLCLDSGLDKYESLIFPGTKNPMEGDKASIEIINKALSTFKLL